MARNHHVEGARPPVGHEAALGCGWGRTGTVLGGVVDDLAEDLQQLGSDVRGSQAPLRQVVLEDVGECLGVPRGPEGAGARM